MAQPVLAGDVEIGNGDGSEAASRVLPS